MNKFCARPALLAGLFVCQVAALSAPPTFTVQELPLRPTSINNRDEIVGRDSVTRFPELYYKGQVTPLADYRLYIPIHNSDSGFIVGASNFVDIGFFADQQLNLTGVSAWLGGVNNRGTAVGRGGRLSHAVIYENGVLSFLPGGIASAADQINDRGTICGGVINGGFIQDLAIWQDGALIDVGNFGYEFVEGEAINQAGMITGYATTITDVAPANCFVYQGGVATILDNPPGTAEAFLWSLNNSGRAVGQADDDNIGGGNQFGTYYENGTLYNINNLLDSSAAGWYIVTSRAINDRGMVVALANQTGNPFDPTVGVLLTPVVNGGP